MSLTGPAGVIAFGVLFLIAAAVQSKSIPSFGEVDWEKYRRRVAGIGTAFVAIGVGWGLVDWSQQRRIEPNGIGIEYLIGPPASDILAGIDDVPPDFGSFRVVGGAGDWTSVDETLLASRLGEDSLAANATRCSPDGLCNRTLYLVVRNNGDESLLEPNITWHVREADDSFDQQYVQLDEPPTDTDPMTLPDLAPQDGILITLATVLIDETKRSEEGIAPPLPAVGNVRYPVTFSHQNESDREVNMQVRSVADQFAIKVDNVDWYGVGG